MKEVYAVAHNGDILVDTISSTPRAAMVNWLVVSAGVLVWASDTDEVIRHRYIAHSRTRGAELVRIEVSENYEPLDPVVVRMV